MAQLRVVPHSLIHNVNKPRIGAGLVVVPIEGFRQGLADANPLSTSASNASACTRRPVGAYRGGKGSRL